MSSKAKRIEEKMQKTRFPLDFYNSLAGSLLILASMENEIDVVKIYKEKKKENLKNQTTFEEFEKWLLEDKTITIPFGLIESTNHSLVVRPLVKTEEGGLIIMPLREDGYESSFIEKGRIIKEFNT